MQLQANSLLKKYSPLILAASACFLVMFQSYLAAPLIPDYIVEFRSYSMNLTIPAFAIPFAIGSAINLILIPRGYRPAILPFSLMWMSTGCLLLALAKTAPVFLVLRALTGLGSGAILPSAILIAGTTTGAIERAKQVMMMIFALAFGMTFGPVTGAWLNHLIGWRALYQIVGAVTYAFAIGYLVYQRREQRILKATLRFRQFYEQIITLSGNARNIYVNTFIYLTGLFHSGVFIWITSFFSERYQLSQRESALTLLIFGLPGLLVIIWVTFRERKDHTRQQLSGGLLMITASLLLLLIPIPSWLANLLLVIISVGYNFSLPLFPGIIRTPIAGDQRICTVLIGSSILYLGYGTGPLLMLGVLHLGKTATLSYLLLLEILLTILANHIWLRTKDERAGSRSGTKPAGDINERHTQNGQPHIRPILGKIPPSILPSKLEK